MAHETTTMDILPKDWEKTLFSLLDEGGSLAEFLKAVDITRKNHARLMKDNQEYLDTIDKAKLHSEAWWIKFGRENLITPKDMKINQGMYGFCMKNRFGWRDSPLNKESGDTIISDLTRDAELEAKFKKEPEKQKASLIQ